MSKRVKSGKSAMNKKIDSGLKAKRKLTIDEQILIEQKKTNKYLKSMAESWRRMGLDYALDLEKQRLLESTEKKGKSTQKQ